MIMDRLTTGLGESYPSANVTSAFVEEEAVFPNVTVRQKNNVPLRRMNTADCAENYSVITYEITVYSSKRDRSQSECRKVLNLADGIMQDIGFRRIYMSENFNLSRTLTRRYARYEAIIRAPMEIGEDTVFEVYRR
jgi:hypothetical protein